jgi:hypothetical protein
MSPEKVGLGRPQRLFTLTFSLPVWKPELQRLPTQVHGLLATDASPNHGLLEGQQVQVRADAAPRSLAGGHM